MNARRTAKVRGTLFFLGAILLAAMIAGCTSGTGVRPEDGDATDQGTTRNGKLITGITLNETPDAVVVSIMADHMPDYTLAEPPLEQAVVLYFPEAGLAAGVMPPATPNALVGAVSAAELIAGGPSKVVIPMNRPALPYEARRGDDNRLDIVFSKAAAAESASAPAEAFAVQPDVEQAAPVAPLAVAATRMEQVTVQAESGALDIIIKADGTITDFKRVVLKSPPRLAFDFPGIKGTQKAEQRIAVDSPVASRVRHFAHDNYLRVVADLKSDRYLEKAEAYPMRDGLLIHVGDAQTAALAAAQQGVAPVARETAAVPEAAPAVAAVATRQPVAVATRQPVAVNRSGKPALVNRIDFIEEPGGRSSLEIGTTHPVNFEMRKAAANKFYLKLDDADIQKTRQRPLITTRFESAVDLIMPVQTPKMKEQGFSVINFELREEVAYALSQDSNTLRVEFEPSSIAPDPAKKVVIPTEYAVEAMISETAVAGAPAPETFAPALDTTASGQPSAAPAEDAGLLAAAEEAPAPTSVFGKKKKYTGEPIALDFYKTDIRNVIRILKDVSGKNFAIDEDVEGSVTLSFVNPVPWDQVLDLILEMNNLGMSEKEGIIRIATQASLTKQKESEKAALTAQQDLKKAEETLAPLVTEYFSISYANAEKDVLPHITLSDRGHAKVDSRTNQLIMTDVVENVEKAREIIVKIDKVTPQVMIKARIVETSTSFSREFGTEWGIDNKYNSPNINIGTDGTYRNEMGGTYTYDVALNSLTSPVQNLIGINFARIIGTPFSLDAKLSLMESTGDVKIISTPKVVTLDNKTATISQGIEYPYTVVEDGEADVKFKQIDLKLDVTPHVTPDNRISMKLNIRKNDVGEIISGEQSFNTKEAVTELLVNDGDTVVIGGIIKERQSAGQRGVPWLSNIPVLGYLFKYTTKAEEKSELLIFITPNVVRLD